MPAVVQLRSLQLPDVDRAGVEALICAAIRDHSRQRFVALHVEALNHYGNAAYRNSLANCTLYCDGFSAVVVARAAGSQHIESSPTTDLGPQVLQKLNELRPHPRIGLIGGPVGLSQKAADVLADQYGVEVAYAVSGYTRDWTTEWDTIGQSVDLLFIGMGTPIESMWLAENADKLDAGAVVTCGGWFGFVAGDEPRAPLWLRNLHLEWAHRLVQNPRRLWKRYVTGLFRMIKWVAICRWSR